MVCVTLGQHAVSRKSECSVNEFWSSGLCCNRCAPGFKLVKKCSVGSPTECEKCSEGTYQEKVNYYPNCFRCKECSSRHHMEVVSPCSYQNNTVCGCQMGYRKKILDGITWTCVPFKNRHSENNIPML
ncbi:hypothetical protein DNTS_001105 [Danionella cerebrum]|uniref:TNFR-Cys domain-containing protein n=1 Tax=Danionella cerebrum TaxID=2873325 RepID=A0A553Q979_9TELE|nr:hypothetical protein DNTS_001105 [Danionella translucida]